MGRAAVIDDSALDAALQELHYRAVSDVEKMKPDDHYDMVSIVESFWCFLHRWEDRVTSELLRIRPRSVSGKDREAVMVRMRERPAFRLITDYLLSHGFMYRVGQGS